MFLRGKQFSFLLPLQGRERFGEREAVSLFLDLQENFLLREKHVPMVFYYHKKNI
jgi:hypothetical protein